jgi:Transposase DDE domain group 1
MLAERDAPRRANRAGSRWAQPADSSAAPDEDPEARREERARGLPSGRFAANGAWLAVQVIAHNLARWTARLSLGEGIVTTKTLRRRLFGLVGRLTRSARRLTLHLPARWPWAISFAAALARLREIPLLA